MRYRSVRRIPVPLVTTGNSGKRPEDAEGRYGSPLGEVVREGETERGRAGKVIGRPPDWRDPL